MVFFGDTLENICDTQMRRNTRFENHCLVIEADSSWQVEPWLRILDECKGWFKAAVFNLWIFAYPQIETYL